MTDQEKEAKKTEEFTPAAPKDVLVETKHTVTIDGREVRYTVTCGTMVLKEEAEKKGDKEGEAEGEKPPRYHIFCGLHPRWGRRPAQTPINLFF